MRAHQLSNGVVVNTVEVHSLDDLPGLIEATEGGIGWLWDGQTLTPPPAAPEAVPPKSYTALEFLDLFTEAEQLAVVTASMTLPVVKLWYDRMLAAGCITIADERTGAGLDALVGAGLLTAERKVEIVGEMS